MQRWTPLPGGGLEPPEEEEPPNEDQWQPLGEKGQIFFGSELAIRPWNVKGWLGFDHVRPIPERSSLREDFSWDEAWIPSNPKLDRMHLRSALKPMNDWRCKLDFGIFSRAAVKGPSRGFEKRFSPFWLGSVDMNTWTNRDRKKDCFRQTDRPTDRHIKRLD